MGLLSPVHAVLRIVGIPVDELSIQEVKDAKNDEPAARTLLVPAQKLKLMKESLKERQRILKEAENSP